MLIWAYASSRDRSRKTRKEKGEKTTWALPHVSAKRNGYWIVLGSILAIKKKTEMKKDKKLTKAQDHDELLLLAYSHANNSFPCKISKDNVVRKNIQSTIHDLSLFFWSTYCRIIKLVYNFFLINHKMEDKILRLQIWWILYAEHPSITTSKKKNSGKLNSCTSF